MNIFQKRLLILLIFFSAFFLRVPAYFNDYYDVDELSAIVQTKQYFSGLIPGIDFKESKLPVYHALFKFCYLVSPSSGWILLHILTAVIAGLTAVFVYKTAKLVSSAEKTALIAGILYSVMISSFNRYFMATNGEIIYNLPLIAGCYFFCRFINKGKLAHRILYAAAFFISAILTSQIKFHGIILFFMSAFYGLFILPAASKGFTIKYFMRVFIILSSAAFIFLMDYLFFNIFSNKLMYNISGKIGYATLVYGMEPLSFITKYLHRQILLAIWHPLIWISFFIFIFSYVKSRKFLTAKKDELFIVFCSAITFLMVFSGGKRLYFHYFMTAYPFISILSAIFIMEYSYKISLFFRKHILKFILIPAVFFFIFNVKDCLIKHFAPDQFINENRISYYFRLIFLGTTNDYLMPDKLYNKAVNYIRNNTKESDKIFVWGDGAYFYYFTNRLPALYHMWPKGTILSTLNSYSANTPQSINEARKNEFYFIYFIEKYQAELFIDTSEAAVSKLGSLSPFPYKITPGIKSYLDNYYIYETTVDKHRIYRRKNGLKNAAGKRLSENKNRR